MNGYQIVVLPRGWVVVGEVTVDGDVIHVARGAVIRRWGTQSGLGELCAGPIKGKTVLDPLRGTLTATIGSVLFTLVVDAAAWSEALA